jgi:iron complex outermembrane receptor protein
MNRYAYIWILVLLPSLALGQLDSIYQLGGVEIQAKRLLHEKGGSKSVSLDSLDISQTNDLGQLLEEKNLVFIKSYGLGSLSSSSFRGGSAQHTAVLWNGFNITNNLSGQSDLSLIPSIFIDGIDLNFGGASGLWGSGAIGGTIRLKSQTDFNSGLQVLGSLGFGSYSNYRQSLGFQWSLSNTTFRIQLLNINAKNNFDYADDQQLNNASLSSKALTFGMSRQLNSKQRIDFHLWLQETEREIPPVLTQTLSRANQNDAIIRSSLAWNNYLKKGQITGRLAWLQDEIEFEDPIFDLESFNKINKTIAEFEFLAAVSTNAKLNFGINHTLSVADVDNFEDRVVQNNSALFFGLHLSDSLESKVINIAIRQGLIDETVVPFSGSIDGALVLVKSAVLKFKLSKDFRNPTLNDLYWNPGGNLELKPEKSLGAEIGIDFSYHLNKRLKLNYCPTAFTRLVKDWIIWLPQLNYWTPQNISEVWSRGIENQLFAELDYIKHKIKLELNTNYILSTNQTEGDEGNNSYEKQLIYTPMYSGGSAIRWSYDLYSIKIFGNYYGYRYTSTDNYEYLDPYRLLGIQISKTFHFKNNLVSLSFRINNILNEEYQAIKNRPMPRRNYQLNLKYKFQKPTR